MAATTPDPPTNRFASVDQRWEDVASSDGGLLDVRGSAEEHRPSPAELAASRAERDAAEVADLRAEVARLTAALDEYRQQCARCRSVQLCAPDGYEWEWRCVDDDACDARHHAWSEAFRAARRNTAAAG